VNYLLATRRSHVLLEAATVLSELSRQRVVVDTDATNRAATGRGRTHLFIGGAGGRCVDPNAHVTRRPRALKVRALFVVLLLLAMDDRPLHLKAATKVLSCKLAGPWRVKLGINGDAAGRKAFLARYRQVRYLFHLVLSVVDLSLAPKDRVLALAELAAMREELSKEEVVTRRARLEKLVADLLEGSVRVCSPEELAGFDPAQKALAAPGRRRVPGIASVVGTIQAEHPRLIMARRPDGPSCTPSLLSRPRHSGPPDEGRGNSKKQVETAKRRAIRAQ
jgi:hypothetical protein